MNSFKGLVQFLSAAIIAVTLFSGCNNDIDIFTKPTNLPVVYGLLDSKDSVHVFKINKIFQGEGNLSDLAKDRSLSEFDNLQGTLIEFNIDNNGDTLATGNSWPFIETVTNEKDSGFFYYPEQKLYKVETFLDKSNIYKIELHPDENTTVTAETELIQITTEILKNSNFYQYQAGLQLAGPSTVPTEVKVNLKPPINAKVMDVFLDFMWYDEYKDGTFSDVHSISFALGTYEMSKVKLNSNDIVDEITVKFSPTAYYQFIADNVDPLDPNGDIKQRIPTNRPQHANEAVTFDFKFVIGGQEMFTYMEVASPSTSLLEEKPEYTNINNGIGVFSCRNFEHQYSLMSKTSIDELVSGFLLGLTGDRGFCHSSNATHPQSCF